MNRRDLLKNVGLGLGTLAVTPLTVSLFQSCQSDLNWGPKFFKENEIINIENFKEEVFDTEDQIQQFEDYKKIYEADNSVLIRNQFDVSEIALKKQKQKIHRMLALHKQCVEHNKNLHDGNALKSH